MTSCRTEKIVADDDDDDDDDDGDDDAVFESSSSHDFPVSSLIPGPILALYWRLNPVMMMMMMMMNVF